MPTASYRKAKRPVCLPESCSKIWNKTSHVGMENTSLLWACC